MGVIIYFIINKFNRQKKITKKTDKDFPRGADNPIKIQIWRRFLSDRNLKIAIIGVFGKHLFLQVQDEIIAVALSKAAIEAAKEGIGTCAKFITNLTESNYLNNVNLNDSVKELILDKRISFSDKINALKCKVASLLETNFPGKKTYLLLLLIGIIVACGSRGDSGLFRILETLRKVFNERKLSRALYEELKNEAIKEFVKR